MSFVKKKTFKISIKKINLLDVIRKAGRIVENFFLANHTTMYHFFRQRRSIICFVFFNATFVCFVDVFLGSNSRSGSHVTYSTSVLAFPCPRLGSTTNKKNYFRGINICRNRIFITFFPNHPWPCIYLQ